MKLRWFSMCDKDGVWTTPVLQMWSDAYNVWRDIPCVTCKTWQEDQYLHDENADFSN